MRGGRALWPFLAIGVFVAPGPPPEGKPPSETRARMEAALDARSEWLFIYGTRDAALTPLLRDRAVAVARRLFGGDTSAVRADRAVSAESIARHHLFLIGGPEVNDWTARLARALPVEFGPHQFRWQQTLYDSPGDAIHIVYPSPLDPHRFLLLAAGNSAAAFARRGGGFFLGDEDWRITRNGELVRSGVFAQSAAQPWHYEPSLDHDREAEARRFERSLRIQGTGAVRMRSAGGITLAPAIRAAAEALAAHLDGAGLAAPGATTLELTLYRSLEEKGGLTRSTRPEHVDAAGAHAALPAGREALDLWSLAALRLIRLGARPDSPWLEPAGVMLAGRFEGEPLASEVRRLYFARLLPSAREAATRSLEWRSPLIWMPARALLARAVFESAGHGGKRALLSLLGPGTPGSLDSLCAEARVPVSLVVDRYRRLADSLARSARETQTKTPHAWRPADGFQRGVCLAHAVSLDHGYLSAECGRELVTLRRMGANWVSLTPFGYLPSLTTPEIHPSVDGGPEEESDEAVCEAGARARAAGLRVWLKPHLWSRGWVGELHFGPAGWPVFFDRYHEWLMHYALLAQREGFDGLVVGHELATASLPFPERWRGLIADVRKVYGGTLTYGANWGEEVRGIAFWDALDVIGVSFYAPLNARPTNSVTVLQAGAARELKGLERLARQTRRPVLLDEVGYPPRAGAAVQPWEEEGGAPDPEAQRACYEAVIRALEPELWVGGVFWWKWFSAEGGGGAFDRSYSPRGKPAEAEMVRGFRSWISRPVQLPAP
jgi:hypothetical protein